MAPEMALYWNRCKDGEWADLFAVDLDDPHFQGLEGVYVIWHGGDSPGPVRVGQGMIRDALRVERISPEIRVFKPSGLFATWARIDRVRRPGVLRFIAETIRPKVFSPLPADAPIKVNLVSKDVPKGAVPEPSQPEQYFENRPSAPRPATAVATAAEPASAPAQPAAAPATAAAAAATASDPAAAPVKGKWVSPLQSKFDALVAERYRKPQQAAGFFGAAKPREKDETLVLHVMQLITTEAVLASASDIHMEPLADRLRLRFRIDGLLEAVLDIPNALDIRLVSHIRVACGLDPEKSIGTARPEDGRMGVVVEGMEADLRLSTFPTPYGDKAVLRIIPRSVNVPKLEELGLLPEAVAEVDELVHRPQGMIIVTGPTGSGKSTTLYTMLQRLNESSRNIVTLEDPIEKKIPGITQGVLAPKVGFTFSEGLRAILRQDPNVIMVGEIRDTETAEIALSASLTGHMLLTTLHTNSALGAISRLIDMKLEPFLIASALSGVFAQRLARRICLKCREEYVPSKPELAQIEELARRAEIPMPAGFGAKLFRGAGCAVCRDTGYQGRVLLLEYIIVTPVLRQLILKNAPVRELQKAALAGGSQLLFQNGLRKASEGLTTAEELARVVGIEQ